jgi:uncharacterized membrane protein
MLNVELERKRGRLLATAVGIVLISIPLVLDSIPPNGIYGFRTSLTLSDPEIWYPANRFLGWALLIAAVASGIVLVLLPATVKRWLLWVTLWVPVLGAVAASFWYLQRFA